MNLHSRREVIVRVHRLLHRFDDGSTLAYGPAGISIPAGSSVAIVGPNGCGKSTLLNHVLGLEVPASGAVTTLGKDAHILDARDRKAIVGVLQNPDDQLFGPTVRDDVAYGPCNWGLKPSVVTEMVDRALERFGLQDKADRIAHALSSGERRRVVLAAAFVGWSVEDPDLVRLVVMDEPFEALDHLGVLALRAVLAEIRQAGRAAMVFTTHDVETIPDLADRLVVLGPGGRVVADGAPLELLGTARYLDEAEVEAPTILQLRDALVRKGLAIDPTLDVEDLANQISALVRGSTMSRERSSLA